MPRQVQDLHVAAHTGTFHNDASAETLELFLHDFIAKDTVTALICTAQSGEVIGYLIY